MPVDNEIIIPTEQDTRIARESGERLALAVAEARAAPYDFAVRLRTSTSGKAMEFSLPGPALRILLDVLQEMGRGNGVSLSSVEKEFTTQQAADFLNVSRPYLIEELLEKGAIPFRRVGNRRRIPFGDLLKYRQAEQEEIARRGKVMMDLMAETERLGLYEPSNSRT